MIPCKDCSRDILGFIVCPHCRELNTPEYQAKDSNLAAIQKHTHNPVTNPKHYDLFPGQQSIDVIQAALTPEEFAGFCKGNALKYRLRAGEKGDATEDIAKANWYRDRLWSESACNGSEPPHTTSTATSATRSPDSGMANG